MDGWGWKELLGEAELRGDRQHLKRFNRRIVAGSNTRLHYFGY